MTFFQNFRTMKILSSLRKPYLASFLAGVVLFVSCKQEALIESPEMSFHYEIFETYRGARFKVDVPKNIFDMPEEQEKYQRIINIINQDLGSDISLTELDKNRIQSVVLKNRKAISLDDLLNNTDKNLIAEFENNLRQGDFDSALKKFEQNVLALKVDEVDFERYNEFANIIRLVESQEPGFFTKGLFSRDPCGDAILSYTLATLALGSCGFVPILCYIAIANKVRTFKNMIDACGNA